MATPRHDTATVSVIVPVFNDAAGVQACLRALAAQSYPLDALEAVVVDNGSVPPLTIGKYPFRTRLIRCTTPGSYAARNAGAKIASGEVLAFTDADCQPQANWLSCGVTTLAAGGGATIVGGAVTFIAPDQPNAVSLYQCATGFGQESNVRDKAFCATANLFCTRAQFDSVGTFDERLLSGGDREWCWRASAGGFHLRYAADAVVFTQPRTRLRAAVRQARRVVAGRKMLHELGLAHIDSAAIARQRSAWQSVRWIVTNPRLRPQDRLRVLLVASVIRAAAAIESWRLALGRRPERR